MLSQVSRHPTLCAMPVLKQLCSAMLAGPQHSLYESTASECSLWSAHRLSALLRLNCPLLTPQHRGLPRVHQPPGAEGGGSCHAAVGGHPGAPHAATAKPAAAAGSSAGRAARHHPQAAAPARGSGPQTLKNRKKSGADGSQVLTLQMGWIAAPRRGGRQYPTAGTGRAAGSTRKLDGVGREESFKPV